MNEAVPQGWQVVKFGDVVSKVNDKFPNRDDWTFDKFVSGNHIDNGQIRVTKNSPIQGNEETIGSAFHMRFQPGHVLYGSRRAYLRKGGIVDFEGICSNTTFILQANESRLLQSLLPFIIQTEDFVKHTTNNSHGSTNPFLNWKDIASYEFKIPNFDVQKNISKILWSIENTVEKMEFLIDSNNKFKNIVMNKLLTKGIKSQEFKSSFIGDIPKSWDAIKFSNIAKSRNGIYKSKEFHGEGIKMVNMGEMFSYTIIKNQHMKKITLTPKEMNNFLLEDGDLLFARRSLVVSGAGKCCLVEGEYEPRTFESSIIRVRVDKNKVLPKYLLYYFNSEVGRKSIERIIRHVAVAGITGSDLMNLDIALPNLKEQKEIVNKIEIIDENIYNTNKSFSDLKQMRNKILNELLMENKQLAI